MGKKNKKIKKAAALSYNVGDKAPKLTAYGKGLIAEKIISAAERNKVPIYHDDNLVEDLMKIEIGSEIPPELYVVVAEVLAFISYIDKKKEEGNEGQKSTGSIW